MVGLVLTRAYKPAGKWDMLAPECHELATLGVVGTILKSIASLYVLVESRIWSVAARPVYRHHSIGECSAALAKRRVNVEILPANAHLCFVPRGVGSLFQRRRTAAERQPSR